MQHLLYVIFWGKTWSFLFLKQENKMHDLNILLVDENK